MRPTNSSRPSILTFRANFSRTWSSLLLATRSVKSCIWRSLLLPRPRYSGGEGRGEGGNLGLIETPPHPNPLPRSTGGEGTSRGSPERPELEHVDQLEEVPEDRVEGEQQHANQEHEEDDDLGRA